MTPLLVAVMLGSSWAPVEAAVRDASKQAGVSDLALYVYDAKDDSRVFALELGSFRSSTNIAVASSSKWISTMVIFEVIRRGELSLESTTGGVLGWKGPNAAITLRQLLSFTSGLDPRVRCTMNPFTTLAKCVESIGEYTAVAKPGTRYDYGSTHLHVAARMAEVATGKSWDQLFDEVLRKPLKLSSDVRYYTFPKRSTGTTNPLIAGGLRASVDEYAKLLALEYHRGAFGGVGVGTPELFDAQSVEPYPGAVIGESPAARVGHPIRYGLGAWLECSTPATGCAKVSSPGAFGFTPWVDREHRYYAIVAMQEGGFVKFSIELEQKVQPLVVAALAR
jgi:D-alanyl-D-alanine-carboxypeptidase/D-alanyl-D-alanine-endopeptidase